jgi:DNA topoisomerase-2
MNFIYIFVLIGPHSPCLLAHSDFVHILGFSNTPWLLHRSAAHIIAPHASRPRLDSTHQDSDSPDRHASREDNSRGEEYTRVTFTPDLKRFGMMTIDPDTVSMLKKRVYNMACTAKDVEVYLNDKRLKIKSFKQFIELYLNSEAAAENSGGAAQAKQSVVYERISDHWEVGFTVSDGTFQHVSFANLISTIKGGSHVNYIADQITKNLITVITKKNNAAAIKLPKIKEHM